MIRDAHSVLQHHLEPGENLLWFGQPKGGIIFRKGDIFLIPFSVFWTAFSIFWTYMASTASLLFALFGLPFIFIGFTMLFGRFIYDMKARKNTYYGITKNRCIILTGNKVQKVKSIQISDITQLEYAENEDGSGSLFLGPQNEQAATLGSSFPGIEQNFMFEAIPDVRKVNTIVSLLQKKLEQTEEG